MIVWCLYCSRPMAEVEVDNRRVLEIECEHCKETSFFEVGDGRVLGASKEKPK